MYLLSLLLTSARFRFLRVLLVFLGGALLRLPAAHAQHPAWEMALIPNGPTTSFSNVRATATDTAGNVYIGGSFYGTIPFGAVQLTSADRDIDGFVAKWSPATGDFVWAQRIGGLSADQVLALAVGEAGLYVGGSTSGLNASFGSVSLTSVGKTDGFVARVQDTGPAVRVDWVQTWGGTGIELVRCIALSGKRVYVGGFYDGNSRFGTTVLPGAGGFDGFVAALTDTGTGASLAWATRIAGTRDDLVSDLAASGSTVYAVGDFRKTAAFGPLTRTSASGDMEGFVLRLTDTGAAPRYDWIMEAGTGPKFNAARSLALQGNSVYVGGWFSETGSFGTLSLDCKDHYGAYVAKLTDTGTTGTYVWAYRVGDGSGYTGALAVREGAVYAAGGFSGSAVRFGNNNIASAGQDDVFVTRLTDAGPTASFDWVQTGGGPGSDQVETMTTGPGGMVYVTGQVMPQVTPPTQPGALSITSTSAFYLGFMAAVRDPLVPVVTVHSVSSGDLNVYPNPARTMVTVPDFTPGTELTLLNTSGRIVRRGTSPWVSVEGLVPGLYLLQAATPGRAMRGARVSVE